MGNVSFSLEFGSADCFSRLLLETRNKRQLVTTKQPAMTYSVPFISHYSASLIEVFLEGLWTLYLP
jgi:hypothetical protein